MTPRIHPRDTRRTEAGFTLIELLIVMSIILIIMTFAVPQVLKMHMNANELSAKQSVETIVQAEMSYNSSYPSNGYACSLQALGGDPASGPATPQSAQLIKPDLASGQKSGYSFAITGCNKVTVNNQDEYTSYQITAVPQSVGHTGQQGFCADENNQLRYDPAGGTNCTQAVQ